jgi:hypothetical protein
MMGCPSETYWARDTLKDFLLSYFHGGLAPRGEMCNLGKIFFFLLLKSKPCRDHVATQN